VQQHGIHIKGWINIISIEIKGREERGDKEERMRE
jgi:hypothetical protein